MAEESDQKLPQTIPEKIAVAMQLKEDGNNHFRQGDFKKAISRYIKVCFKDKLYFFQKKIKFVEIRN